MIKKKFMYRENIKSRMFYISMAVLLFAIIGVLFNARKSFAEGYVKHVCDNYTYVDYEGGVNIVEYDDYDYEKPIDEERIITVPDTLDGKQVIGIGIDYNTNGYTSSGGVFRTWGSVVEIKLPKTIKHIGSNAFMDCYDLERITIPQGVPYIGDKAFWCCESLVDVSMPESITSIGRRAFAQCSSLVNVNIPSSVEYIDEYAFEQCHSLVNVNIPSSVEEIGEYAFYKCYSLSVINIPESVSYIGTSAFDRCHSLKSINVDKKNEMYFDLDGVLCRNGSDWYDDGSEDGVSIDVVYVNAYPGGKKGVFNVTSNMKISEEAALIDALSLEEFSVSKDNPWYMSKDGVLYSKDGKMLYYCPCKKTGTYKIEDGTEDIHYNAFSNGNLSHIIIPDSVKNIGDNAFYKSDQLETIEIGAGVEMGYDLGALKYTSKLKEIIVSSDNKYYKSVNNVLYDKNLTELLLCPNGYNGSLILPDTVKTCTLYYTDVDAYEEFGDGTATASDDIYNYTYKGKITEIYFGRDFDARDIEYDEDEENYNSEPVYSYIWGLSWFDDTLRKVEVSPENKYYISENNMIFSKDKKHLCYMLVSEKKNIIIPDGVQEIHCSLLDKNIISVTIPASVTKIANWDDDNKDVIIYGYAGSEAERFATDSSLKFIALNTINPNITNSDKSVEKFQPVITPGIVKKIIAKNKKGKKIVLSWKKLSGVKGYQIQYSLNRKFARKTKSKITSKTKVTLKRLLKKKSYYIRIRAYKVNANKKIYGDWSKIKKIKIKK